MYEYTNAYICRVQENDTYFSPPNLELHDIIMVFRKLTEYNFARGEKSQNFKNNGLLKVYISFPCDNTRQQIHLNIIEPRYTGRKNYTYVCSCLGIPVYQVTFVYAN